MSEVRQKLHTRVTLWILLGILVVLYTIAVVTILVKN